MLSSSAGPAARWAGFGVSRRVERKEDEAEKDR